MTQLVSGGMHRIAAGVLSGIGIAGAVGSWRMGLWTLGSPDAGLLPFCASLLLAGLAAAAAFLPAPDVTPLDPAAWRRLAAYAAAMLLLCVGPLLAGCVASFAAALLVAMRVGEGMPLKAALSWSIVLSAACVLVFRLLLGVPLPDPVLDRLLGL